MEAVSLHATTVGALDAMYERYDGKGFPGSLSSKEIPLAARVLAIADTFADLTQNPRNPFRKTLRPQEACEVLARFKGTIFDPNLVDLFRTTVTGDDIRARILSSRHMALLVDSDPEETTVLELRLIEQGFEVKIARTAEAALRLLEVGDVEVVVSELDLTPVDGFALLESARKAAWGRDLPWILLTRRQGRTDAQRGFELGVVDYVLKPAPTDVLVITDLPG
jgi:response regulator RpfG family c-di-GMP phosphodiesterase